MTARSGSPWSGDTKMIDPEAFAAVHEFCNDSSGFVGLAPARRFDLDSYDSASHEPPAHSYRRARSKPYNIIPTTPADFIAWRAANAGSRNHGG